MAVFTVEDAQGGVEVIAFPEAYQRAASLIESGTLVLVRGKLERDDESVRVLASEIAPIEAIHERLAREVKIRIRQPAESVAQALMEIVSRHRGDRRLSFEIETGASRLRVSLDVTAQIRVRPSSSLIAEVEQVVGQGAVSLR
jgi:DNA polymerase-3 subunit alpha